MAEKRGLTAVSRYDRLFVEEMTMPNLQVVAENGFFFVQDMDTEYRYGKYNTRQEADEALADWKIYFSS